jgi:hypothetical protein
MIWSSLNRLLRIVRLLVDGLHLQARERKGSRSRRLRSLLALGADMATIEALLQGARAQGRLDEREAQKRRDAKRSRDVTRFALQTHWDKSPGARPNLRRTLLSPAQKSMLINVLGQRRHDEIPW